MAIAVIALAVNRSKANSARLAAAEAVEKAAIEQAARTATLDCYVALGDPPGPESNKHFPCNGIPLKREEAMGSDGYWIVVTVTGVSFLAASDHRVTLECKTDDFHGASSNSLTGLSDGGDLRIFLSGNAGEIGYLPDPIDCKITANGGATTIRNVHITLTLDGSKRFEL